MKLKAPRPARWLCSFSVLTTAGDGSYFPAMPEAPDSEDLLIRRLLLGGAIFVVSGALVTAVIIAFAVSTDFNVMNWLE